MKFCFISLNLFMHGGIQRVIPEIVNKLVEQHDITIVMPYSEEDENVFQLSNKVNIKNMLDFPRHNKYSINGFLSIAIWKTNMKFGYLDNRLGAHIAKRIMFPKRQLEAISKYINEEKYDVVVGITDYYSLLLAQLVPEINCATIGWQHNTFESYFEIPKRNSFGLKKLCQKEFKNLDCLFVLTDIDNAKYSNLFGVKTETLYNPVSFKQIEVSPSRDSSLLFVGRLYEFQKGLDILVEVMRKIVETKPDVRLTVVGDGPDRGKFEQQIIGAGLTSNIKLVGMTSNVENYYNNASIFLHTSRYEGFGVVLIEAMAFGVPVIAFHNNGPDEIIENGKNGILIERFNIDKYAKSVISLLENENDYRALSNHARERAEDFATENIVDKFEGYILDVYDIHNGDIY